MDGACARAIEMGLPGVAFTDHMDFTPWRVDADELEGFDHLKAFVVGDTLRPPGMDVEGYLRCVDRCRETYPDLRILTGVELGEAHRHGGAAAELLGAGRFERVLGSLHTLQVDGEFFEPPGLFRQWSAARVIREYLAEVCRMIEGSDAFSILAHITYPLRYWPTTADAFDPVEFEHDFRQALRMLADSNRALEINTTDRFSPQIVRWWRDEGGQALMFGSDAHDPGELGRRLAEAVEFVEAQGFRAGAYPHDFWMA
jgi:histidinol-phosphatase (PHP family)